jgi:hypothetical protein
MIGGWRALVLVALAGCEHSKAGCHMDLPSQCPSPTPSWSSTVSQVVAADCQSCHSQAGIANDRPFESYSQVYALRGTVLSQVYSCAMPPSDGGVLDDADRQQLIDWLVCGAPNN